MKKIILLVLVFSLVSCFEDNDDVVIKASTKSIQDFIYKGLQTYYLYKDNQPDLANNRFESEQAYSDFLNSYESPASLFNHLQVSQDRFSFLVSDYRVLENALNGTNQTSGMEFGLRRTTNNEIFGYVRYVLPNTPATEKGIERGMLFNRVNETYLTQNNYRSLLDQTNYTIGLATFESGNLSDLSTSISLNQIQYTENPVFISEVFSVENQKIGYLMYNAFTTRFDAELNNAFGNFKAANLDELIIDLRYNSGGSVETCNDLCSMITGQFEGEVFTNQVYNNNFENQQRFFNAEISNGAAINSLNLNKVYVLTTEATASASELLLSSLRPYIDVVQIGTTTTGKFQASVTLYDSPDYSPNNRNLGHRYAMQPLVLKTVNANGFTDYFEGITPTYQQPEDYTNLGELGNLNEPLLNKAISIITGTGKSIPSPTSLEFVGESKMQSPVYQEMYLTDLK